MPNISSIPADYTFLNLDIFISVKGKELAEKLLKQAEDRNPDAFDMYIYNDYFSYGVLDLIDKTLTTLHTKITKKDWQEAYHLLEGLVAFVDFEDIWTQCDDGERVDITNKTIGASAIAVFRGLEQNDDLDSTHFPTLENLLKRLVSFSENMTELGCDSEYGFMCRAIARRLFKNKSEADFSLEIERLNEWANGLDKDEKKDVKAEIEKIANKRTGDERVKPWYAKGKVCDEDDNDPDFKISRVWKEYKEYLSGAFRQPVRGPAKWDISKWTAAERKEFEFDSMDAEASDF